MIDVGFYQLAQRRAEAVLPPLVTKALAAGHRLVIRSQDAALLARLDLALWNFAPDSFLPHGIEAEIEAGRAASQPVLLTAAPLPAANGADCLAQVGDDLPDDFTGLSRVMYLFDADAVETARARWRLVSRSEGLRPIYWRETDGGRFEKAA
ncbi:DNA polymerase III subunit chi [Polymorphobacter fuscus]|uniref:DNA polymerase III subunit chi n=1 Tax=Sandarakinorhabdus fusca TaxID=1439888 RepID=UPI00142FAEBE|nr:DNA polymerase III subunit chi [Polymorphobacter fuscus]NJC07435.1 DNA polymerase-3 subunit chi [Polymorphobacter fuscus]